MYHRFIICMIVTMQKNRGVLMPKEDLQCINMWVEYFDTPFILQPLHVLIFIDDN